MIVNYQEQDESSGEEDDDLYGSYHNGIDSSGADEDTDDEMYQENNKLNSDPEDHWDSPPPRQTAAQMNTGPAPPSLQTRKNNKSPHPAITPRSAQGYDLDMVPVNATEDTDRMDAG